MFDDILDKDEKVIKIFKPNKFKYWLSHILGTFVFSIWIPLITFIGVFAEDEPLPFNTIYWGIGIFVVLFLGVIFTQVLHYKKLVYAYTNKRVLIRTGIIGIDYKSLDMKMIGAVDVYTSFLDKIIGKKTGTIKFGSTASPIQSNNASSSYMFSHINDAYPTYREIKEQIDNYKENKH